MGNIQWLKNLFPSIARKNPLLSMIIMRRVARMLWAYCLIFSILLFSVFLFLSDLYSLGMIPLFILVLFFTEPRIRAALLVSLKMPFEKNIQVSWG